MVATTSSWRPSIRRSARTRSARHVAPRTSARMERTMAASDSGTRHSLQREHRSASFGHPTLLATRPCCEATRPRPRPASGIDLRRGSRTHRYLGGRDVTTVPDIPVVQLPAIDADGIAGDIAPTAPGSIWAVDVPHSRRVTPVLLAVLGVVAGLAA